MTTITQEQFRQIVLQGCASGMSTDEFAKGILAAAGITIAPPAPSEKMVKLALDAGLSWVKSEDACDDPRSAFSRGCLAALQHAEKVVRDAEQEHAGHFAGLREGVIISRVTKAILNQIGAE